MRCIPSAALAAALILSAGAPVADAAISSNWAGYAASGRSAAFKRVSSAFTQPATTCTPGRSTYSAVWVGLGGFARSSSALEQVGTEADCTARGGRVARAWYELVPSYARVITRTVRAGDQLVASVSASGRSVTLRLANRTRGWSFSRTVSPSAVDLSSAEWIVEAPSQCDDRGNCSTLPLADFGSAGFSDARATTTAGHTGTISDPRWNASPITLSSALAGVGRRFAAQGTLAGATPGPLVAGGSAFSVGYVSGATGAPGPPLTRSVAPPR